MNITGMPERFIWEFYPAPSRRPVTSSIEGSYHHRFTAFLHPNAPWLRLDPSCGKFIHCGANSIIQKLCWITSWMPVAKAQVHLPPQRQYRLGNARDGGAAPASLLVQVLQLVFQAWMCRNLSMTACWLLSWMSAEKAHHRILICCLDDHCNRLTPCCDVHLHPHRGYIVCLSLRWKDEEGEEKCGTFVWRLKKAASDKYNKTKAVTKGDVDECIVNEFKCCLKEREHWDDLKHCHDPSFYPVKDSRILSSPATHASNSLDGLELRTQNGRWQGCLKGVDWHLWTIIIITMSKKWFLFDPSFGLTSAGERHQTTNYMIAIHWVLSLPVCLSKNQTSQWSIPTSWTLNPGHYAWLWTMQ